MLMFVLQVIYILCIWTTYTLNFLFFFLIWSEIKLKLESWAYFLHHAIHVDSGEQKSLSLRLSICEQR